MGEVSGRSLIPGGGDRTRDTPLVLRKVINARERVVRQAVVGGVYASYRLSPTMAGDGVRFR